MEIKNLKKVSKRIKKAVKKQENIVLFGDGDLDGTTAVLITEEAISNIKGKISLAYFPDRDKGGYGLSFDSLEDIKEYAPGLLVVLDCGIGSFQEVERAKEIGFEVIIIDHHEILNGLPKALIVDPKQPKDKYPFKKLTASSLAYRLSKIMLGKNVSKELDKSLMELASLGAVADMMPEKDTNKTVIVSGLNSIFSTFRVGLRAVVEIVKKPDDSPRSVFSKLVSALNITKLENNLTESYILFKSNDIEEARKLASRLLTESEQRKREIYDIVGSIEDSSSLIIFEGDEYWGQALTGAIASRVCNKFKKPTFIYKLGEERSRGSVRMPRGLDGVEAMKSCSDLLEVFGGHPPAAGFCLKNEDLEAFQKGLEKYFYENNN